MSWQIGGTLWQGLLDARFFDAARGVAKLRMAQIFRALCIHIFSCLCDAFVTDLHRNYNIATKPNVVQQDYAAHSSSRQFEPLY